MEEKARKRELEGSDSDEEDKPKVRREMLKARDYKVHNFFFYLERT